MLNTTLQLAKKILGITLIIIGVISGFIPIVQGWIFIVAGLLLLGMKKETIKKGARKIKEWFWRLRA
jgi:hypothetical protein